ncbi:MAG TPA: macro domain-containing protein [Pirellulaceae bacterium]|nr:macro domain-containing protein [Pirellulaceae bacterium]
MQILLVYRDDALGDAWRSHFHERPDVQIVQDDITTLTCNAVVSPANPFGFMDGGLDAALSERFGWNLQTDLQQQIQQLRERELLVGKALVIPTNDSRIPWLIAAPTMRVPMSFNIATSINAYLAMKAILIAVQTHPEIDTVAIPGLCTGVGRMPPQTASKQMSAAYNEVVRGNRPQFADFGDAQKQQIELNPDGLIWDY